MPANNFLTFPALLFLILFSSSATSYLFPSIFFQSRNPNTIFTAVALLMFIQKFTAVACLLPAQNFW